tara:strand:+ start:363 stop:1034 length:672 start_codon:yes stop_codon:yes gene_type:complete
MGCSGESGDKDSDTTTGSGKDGSTWWDCKDLSADRKGSAPNRSSSCEVAPASKVQGCKVPWVGAQVGAKSYTCNRCVAGDPLVQDRWRAIDGKTEDPSVILSDQFREVLTIDGNTWHLHVKMVDPNGVEQEVFVDGWYWCSDAAEVKSGKNVHHVLRVDGSDFFGWDTSYLFTAYFLTNGPDLLAWSMDRGFEQEHIGELIYCRIGSTVNGKLCTDPFDESQP